MKVKVAVQTWGDVPDPEKRKELISFLRSFRDWTQYVIDEVWKEYGTPNGRIRKVPSRKVLHHWFYPILREKGFRGRHCSMIINSAKEILKSVKSNRGAKPKLERLMMRDDRYDFKFDPERYILDVPLFGDSRVEIYLAWSRKLEHYIRAGTLKAATIAYDNDRFNVSLVFDVDVKVKEPRTVMGIDLNFYTVVYTILTLDGELVTMGTIPFRALRKSLRRKKMANAIKRKYGKRWKYVKGIKEAIDRLERRRRNITDDAANHIAKRIIEIAKEHRSVIVVENLKEISVGTRKGKKKENGERVKPKRRKPKSLREKLSLWGFRKIQSRLEYKALMNGLLFIKVDPKGTSQECPLGGEIKHINYRYVILPNGMKTTRDLIASWNIALRGIDKLRKMSKKGNKSEKKVVELPIILPSGEPV